MKNEFHILHDFNIIHTKSSQYKATKNAGKKFNALIDYLDYKKSCNTFLRNIRTMDSFTAFDIINFGWCLKYLSLYPGLDDSIKVYYSALNTQIVINLDGIEVSIIGCIDNGASVIRISITKPDGKIHLATRETLVNEFENEYIEFAYRVIKYYTRWSLYNLFLAFIEPERN